MSRALTVLPEPTAEPTTLPLTLVIRRELPTAPGASALALSFTGVALALVTGWLGGELVDRLGVGVDDGAHLDAPSSLSGQPAGARSGRRDGPDVARTEP